MFGYLFGSINASETSAHGFGPISGLNFKPPASTLAVAEKNKRKSEIK